MKRRQLLAGMAAGAALTLPVGSVEATQDDATHTAVNSGDWSDPDVWSESTVPGDGAKVVIDSGVNVTLGSEQAARLRYVRVDGKLTFAPTVDTHLRAETLMTTAGSTIEIGTSDRPVASGSTARVTFVDTGSFDHTTTRRGLMIAGDVEIHGQEKTAWTELESHPGAGDTDLDLPADPVGWASGDEVIVPGMNPDADEDERRTIRSVSGSTVTLDAALEYDHAPPSGAFDSYVLNVTRNVEFRSENDTIERRGHAMIMSAASDVRWAAFNVMGRTDKSKIPSESPRDVDLSGVDPNPRARYNFHYHKTGSGAADPHIARGLVAEDSPGWAFVNHHSHAHITDCISHDVTGAGFVAEGGSERGSFERNFALRSEGSGETVDNRSDGAHGGATPVDDFGHAGHGFWFQGPLPDVTDNVAAGHRHQAFSWWLRPLLDDADHTWAESSPDRIEDSRVSFVPNIPMEYIDEEKQAPLLDAIESQRFKGDSEDQLMWDTQKIPSTFAATGEISGNTAFASAGGVDFNRHSFKWKHERFSDFNVIDDMTVHSIGKFVDDDGDVQEPNPPKHLEAGHQGRGGSVGVTFRYTSNVSLKNSHLHGGGLENSLGIPFHDYLWTTTVENTRVEDWHWGVATGEHRIDWLKNNTFADNDLDVHWSFDNAGPAILDGNDLDSVRHEFQTINEKAPEVLYFDQERGVRVNGRSAHVEGSAPDYVPFPDEDALSGVNNIEKYVDTVDDETNLIGMTNAEMLDEYGICISGALLPEDATSEPFAEGFKLDPVGGRDPATSVYLGTGDAGTLGQWEVVSDPDTAGTECLSPSNTSSPRSNPASYTFDCAAGTYEIFARIRPGSWNGDTVEFRIDGGDWKAAEKLKGAQGFAWHDVAPNGGETYEWELTEGRHTLDIASGSGSVRVDEVLVTADQEVVGGYGLSGGSDGNSPPAVDSLSVSEAETKSSDAAFDVSWAVSDVDGDLSSVDLQLVQDGDGSSEDSASLSVAGGSASGTTRLVATGDDGSGNSYTVTATATDSSGNGASSTASVTATASDSAPALDQLSLSEADTSGSDAEIDASWSVSDADGDLSAVELTLTQDSDGATEDTATVEVAGDAASGTTRLVAAGDDGSGNSYTVDATVTDAGGLSDSATAAVTVATDDESQPAVDGISLSEVETDSADATFDASWSVSDADGDLSAVEHTLTQDSDGATEDTATVEVAGDAASGTTRLVAAGDDGSGNSYTLATTVTDSSDLTDTATASAGESEAPPALDNFTASEVETDTADAAFDASWDVSDADGDLDSLELVLTQDSDGATEDTVVESVSGSSASDTTRLVATGDDGSGNSYTVDATVTDAFGNAGSATDSVEEGEPDVQTPYTDHDLSRIEAEDFDVGGEGVAYHDTSSGNNGGAYRDTDVDIQETSDDGGGYNLAWVESGEWWEYTVEVPEDGEYDLRARLAGKNATTLDFLVDGTTVATADVPDTGGWQEWTTVDAGSVSLPAGTHVVRLQSNGTDFNINWFGFEAGSSGGQTPYTDHDLSRIEAEDFDVGGEGVAYHDTSSGNNGGAYRDTDVDIQETSDDAGDYNLAWVESGEWWEYTVEVPEDGEYDLRARLAGKNDTSVDVSVDGSPAATVDVPDTGGWQTWTTVDHGPVTLSAGTHVIRVEANGGEFNFNWFGFQR